jgi:phenylalanyl-tRNA synthetase beta chain
MAHAAACCIRSAAQVKGGGVYGSRIGCGGFGGCQVVRACSLAQIEQIARQTEKKLLKKVELFDVYEGDKLPAGKKSYAVNFILQDEEKTMGDKQIDAIMQKLIANIKKQLGAELR